MSLIDKIEDLQNKPEHCRRRVLVASVLIIMSAVVLIWVSTIKFSLAKQDSKDACDPVAVFCEICKDGYKVLTAGAAGSFGQAKKIYEKIR